MAGPRQSSAVSVTPLDGARVLVVEARFYDKLADELLAGATAVLHKAGCRVDVVIEVDRRHDLRAGGRVGDEEARRIALLGPRVDP